MVTSRCYVSNTHGDAQGSAGISELFESNLHSASDPRSRLSSKRRAVVWSTSRAYHAITDLDTDALLERIGLLPVSDAEVSDFQLFLSKSYPRLE